MEKVIFLDIDGVLNCQSSKPTNNGLLGIDKDKLERLSKIVNDTGAEIILCSSWKSHWSKNDKDHQGTLATYLDKEFNAADLQVVDKTTDMMWNRGEGIANYVRDHDIKTWIVIDDEEFKDYEELGIISHQIKPSFYKQGLTDEHVEMAIKMLNEQRII